ncbi:hypothetical protein QBC36DRAFT_73580 [Triangularia setosa]|uniref:Uncharacterized protein n=1 Tax=Triangularia setosa TaxID=2587417 RepID=A0AAN6W069_9PEZI|nr:hypothetical protein QBC36DRAFT_73580 [Podospora setosa]
MVVSTVISLGNQHLQHANGFRMNQSEIDSPSSWTQTVYFIIRPGPELYHYQSAPHSGPRTDVSIFVNNTRPLSYTCAIGVRFLGQDLPQTRGLIIGPALAWTILLPGPFYLVGFERLGILCHVTVSYTILVLFHLLVWILHLSHHLLVACSFSPLKYHYCCCCCLYLLIIALLA